MLDSISYRHDRMARFKWLLVAAYATLAVANPLPISEADHLQTRQTGINANDIMGGSCKDFTLIFVRGSWEPGNMVSQFLFKSLIYRPYRRAVLLI